jgi:serine/threonine-protein phosphatase 5
MPAYCPAHFLALLMQVLYPQSMFLARGNHESKNMNKMYGFEGEVKSKYNSTMVEVFRETFCWMPLGHVLGSKVCLTDYAC